ncbi:GNAT family N-acetyltransferase [Nocardioides agariphilus]|uniref:GNAT family N-acetyltransferase n=1 Tax=Nocardioides agariphilus TaxID=433664 RepID=A0A930YHT2_9ACTN|nr:GNAT family N-acetyltransferase [Nocardioides agariphilus]
MRQPLSDSRPRAVAVVERDGKVLVIRRHLDGRDYAVLPGGGIEDGETPAEAAVRELREECTLDGEVVQLLMEADHGDRQAFYYRVTGVEGEPVLGGEEAAVQDETNQHHPMWASPKDLELMGLLPEGLVDLVVGWLWPLNVRRAETDDDWLVERLWQLYAHDLSEFRGTTPAPDGTFGRGHLGWYDREDPDRACYLASLGDRPIGFALVRGLTHGPRSMGEFFVARSARGAGQARTFAEQVVRMHPGAWQIAFQEENVRAAKFWRRFGADVLTDVAEELREVPGKPHIPPDVWLSGTFR